MKIDNSEIRRAATITGISVYYIKKWLREGLLVTADPAAVEAVAASLGKQKTPKLVNYEQLLFLSGISEDAYRIAYETGAILPTVDGMFYLEDAKYLQKHRFAILPRCKQYVPTRPTPAFTYARTYTKAEYEAKAANIDRAFGGIIKHKHNGRHSGLFYVPEGYPKHFWVGENSPIYRYERNLDAPAYAPAIETTPDGKTRRIEVLAYHHRKAKQHTAVVRLMDDYGVWITCSGMAEQHFPDEAIAAAMRKALLSIGFFAKPATTVDGILDELEQWLRGELS